MRDDQITKVQLLPPSEANPRNSEASIIQLKDGRLLLAYSHFYGRDMDAGGAYIAGRFSEDNGRTWTGKDIVLVENEGKFNVMSVSLLRLLSGEIALFYLVKNSQSDCIPYVRISNDEARTWGNRIRVISQEGYYGLNNDRVIQLPSGRLIVPVEFSPGAYGPPEAPIVPPCQSMCFLSDDKGISWHRSQTVLEPLIGSKSGLQEPGVVELKDSSVMMFMRTDLGGQFVSYSYDRGETWTNPVFSSLKGPCSPATIKRIPSTGDLLAVWNTPSAICRRPLPRCTLSTAISKDEGKSWQNIKTLEYDPEASYCYVSLLFVDDKAIMTYAHRHNFFFKGGMLLLTLVDINWFYE